MGKSITELRIKILKEMDTYARENFDEDLFYDVWLANGVPDECDEETYRYIAETAVCWLDCIEAFSYCCKQMGIIEE